MNFVICSVFIISGAINTLLGREIDERGFDSPLIQTFFMFLGETLCLLFNRNSSLNFSKLILIIPVILDTTSSFLVYKSLSMIPISTFQILKTCNIPIIMIFSRLFLHRKMHSFEILGSALVLLGALIVGTSDQTDKINNQKLLIGSLMVLLSCIANAAQVVYEEWALNKYNVSPLYVVGIEGLYGIIITLILIFITREDVEGVAIQIKNDSTMAIMICSTIIIICIANFTGLFVVKNISSQYRSILEPFRSIIVWIFSLLFGLETDVNMIKVCGFTLVILGLFVYNQTT